LKRLPPVFVVTSRVATVNGFTTCTQIRHFVMAITSTSQFAVVARIVISGEHVDHPRIEVSALRAAANSRM